MEEKGSLGIFLLRDKAVAVWISGGTPSTVRHEICLTRSENEPAALPLQAARAVMRQGFAFDEVFVAVDCGSYTQYNLHSEFEDIRQIESTIKFDVEEAAATDAMNLAVTFEVTDVLPTGSQVTAYTADRQLLTDILLDLQEGGLDPTFMEPDAVCLTRALDQTAKLSERPEALFVVLSGGYCYILRPNPGRAPTVRTFLVGGGNVTNTLVREVLLAAAADQQKAPLKSVVLVGSGSAVDTALLHQRTGLEVLSETPERALHGVPEDGKEASAELLINYEVRDEQMSPAELLIAYGAAMAQQARGPKADFRRDFMPYQGKRKVMEGSLRLIGISMTVLLLAVAVFFQLKAFNMKGYASRLEEKNLAQYRAVMGTLPRGANPSMKLRGEYDVVKAEKDGPGAGDSKSVPARLTYFLQAVNRTKNSVDINIRQVIITERSMTIRGDTNNRTSTNALIDAIKKHPQLAMGSYRYKQEANRDSFDITVNPTE